METESSVAQSGYRTPYVTKDDLELLVLLPPPPILGSVVRYFII